MKRIMGRVAAVVAAAAMAPILATATVQAAPGTVYFNAAGLSCAIAGDGTVGCDFGSPMRLQYSFLPIPIPVNEIVIDRPALPAHPTFDAGTPYTRPGGNPGLESVATGTGPWGPYIEHAGARCEVGFHGSFTCTAKGHAFTSFGGTLSA